TSWIEPSASASPPRTPLCALGGESGHMPTESKLSSLQGTSTCLVFSACAKPDVGQRQDNPSFSARASARRCQNSQATNQPAPARFHRGAGRNAHNNDQAGEGA